MQILVISSIYPGQGTPDSFTPVVHYFVREWVKLGYDVRVIHTCTYFPKVYYKAPKWMRRLFQSRFGFALPESRLDKEDEYVIDGVKVFRIPMRKCIPMGRFSNKELKKASIRIESYIRRDHFSPMHIISHWLNPQLILMSNIKRVTGATSTMVLHGANKGMDKPFKNWPQLMKDVDIWGYRSIKTKEQFERMYGKPIFSFRCLSGIPEYYFQNVPHRDGSFNHRFVQVGLLIERKYPDRTIDAVSSLYENNGYSLNIIGDGLMRKELEEKIERLGADGRIHLLGRLPRKDVISVLDESDVFILISKNEVFGLAYIEAMARGCIVIGARGEGMEGIIEHGVNGFFCEAGNSEELSRVVKYILSLTDNERKQISEAAIATSRRLSDVAVAKDYIETVVRFGEIERMNVSFMSESQT